MKHLAVVSSAVLALSMSVLGACADAPPPATASATPSRELSRDEAVNTAAQDAVVSLRMVDVANVSVTRSGAFWVVDLHGQRGQGVRYAITAADGTIRERRFVQ